MENDMLFEFLQEDKGEDLEVQLGGEFTPSGLVGPWVAEVLYVHMAEAEFTREEIGYDLVEGPFSGWYRYYWADPHAAEAAREHVGAKYNANAEWVFRIATDNVINFNNDEARSKWGSDILFGCRMTSSPKYRHGFSLIALPAAVSAIATLQGWDTPPYDLMPLYDLSDESGEEQCLSFIGGKSSAGDVFPWEESILGRQRIELWRALGEENEKAVRPIGALTSSGKPDPLAATSERLNVALRIAYRRWPAPYWAAVHSVPDPRPDAVNRDGRRLTTPAIVTFFRDEQEARASLEGGDTTAAAATPAADAPAIPAMWAEHPRDWEGQLVEIEGKVGSKPLPIIFKEAGGEDALGCTLAELSAWLEYRS